MWWTLSVPSRAPPGAKYLYRYRYGLHTAYIQKDDAGSAVAAEQAEAAASQRTTNIDTVERERRLIMGGVALLCSALSAALLCVSEPAGAPRTLAARALRALLALPLAIGLAYGGSAGCGL
jgi:hypothetical protein